MFTGIIGALGTVESVTPVLDAQGRDTGAAHITITLVILLPIWGTAVRWPLTVCA